MNIEAALRDFPQLETERLLLRAVRPSDRYSVLRLFGDPLVTRYNDVDTLESLEDADGIIDWITDRFATRRGIRWAIILKTSGDHNLIGTCGYNHWSERGHYASIGYDLMSPYWGQGITPEAVGAMLDFGFNTLGLNRVEADVTIGNTASSRVLTKLGFTFEGVLRQRGYWKGEYHDLQFYSLLREEYLKLPPTA